ncbi:MAG: rhodanese-like domain-containing protein [Rhodospirillales bacterium]|nr:rhodanese-like domain-containing protein [Rhodospirillales bacterium]
MADSRGGIVTDIDNATLKRLHANGVVVVDIRRPDEWKETGVIAGSRLITLFTDERGRVNPAFMPDFSKTVSPDDAVVIVCRTGSRSSFLADALARQMRYSKVYNLRHGILGWIGAGNEVVALR